MPRPPPSLDRAIGWPSCCCRPPKAYARHPDATSTSSTECQANPTRSGSPLWESQAALEGALEIAKRDAGELVAEVMQIAADFSRVDLEPIGGPGLDPRPRGGWERVGLDGLEDQAAGFGLAGIQEMRSPVEPLGLERTGITLQRILPRQRQSFGHVHANAEETYIVLAGSGTLRIEDDELAVAAHDAVRVAPTLTRAFEAGPEGLEYLAVGPRHRGDGDMTPGWWG